jgi:hypothetical protein
MRRFATVALIVAVAYAGVSAQTLRERVREFGIKHPNAVYRFPRSPADPAAPLTIEDIARRADLAVQGKLTKRDTRLIDDQVVVTDYTIVEPLLIAGRLPVQQTTRPGAPTAPVTVSLWGGKMLVDGVRVEAEGGYAVKEGSTYILFLWRARQSTLPNNYELYDEGIFEIDGTRVIPLTEHVFNGNLDQNVTDFIRRVGGARRSPQK